MDVKSGAADPYRTGPISRPVRGGEPVFFIAGFYQLRDGRIASAKIYREGSAEVA
jgi:hypothetical protein